MAFYEEDANEGANDGKFLKLLEGCIVSKSTTPKEGYEEYNTKNPQTDEPVKYYIKKYKGGVEGKITRLERVELEGVKVFGWNLHMADDDGEFSIFFKDDKVTTERLLKMFESINLDEDVLVKVWKDEQGWAVLNLLQNGENVPQKWNKDNLPEPKKVKGRWDYSGVSEFLYNNAIENILPQFAEAQAEADAKRAERAEKANAATATAAPKDDTIPF
jgi:hypothetical protein